MKILHVADLHLRWFDWVQTHAKAFDLLVIAGDLQDAFSNRGMVEQARICRDWLLSLETPTVVVSGNHDYYSKSPRVSVDPTAEAAWLRRLGGSGKILAVDGQHATFRDTRIATVGWAQPPEWEQGTEILVTHAPPSGCTVAADGAQDVGDAELWRALLDHPAPRLILSGHVHEPRRFWCRWGTDARRRTTVLVPGHNDLGSEPQRWEIDLDAGVAKWIGNGDFTIEI